MTEIPSLAEIQAQCRERTRQFLRVAALVVVLAIVGSVVGALTGEKTLFLYKEQLHLSPSAVGTLNLLLGIPAYVQFFIGAWADLLPLWGYHRRSYYVLGKLISAGSLVGLAWLHQYHFFSVACLLLLSGVGGVLRAVIVNAVMVAVGNRTGTFGRLQTLAVLVPLLLSWSYSAHLSGYFTQHWSYHQCYLLAGILTLLSVPLVLLIDEQRVVRTRHAHETPEEHAARLAAKQADRERTAAALRKAAATPSLWVMVAYVFYLIITPGIYTAQVYYMTDVLHLSKQFIGDVSRWSSVGTLAGLGIFWFVNRKMPVWTLVWGAWLMDCLSYPILMGLHNASSARLVYLAGGVVSVLYGLCLNTLAARACPPGIEGTVYGLVMAAIALAGNLSEKFGGWLYDYFGPLNPAHHYTIAHGWYSALWVGLGFTVLGVVLIPFLPAWAKSNEPLRAGTDVPEEI